MSSQPGSGPGVDASGALGPRPSLTDRLAELERRHAREDGPTLDERILGERPIEDLELPGQTLAQAEKLAAAELGGKTLGRYVRQLDQTWLDTRTGEVHSVLPKHDPQETE